MTTTRIDDALNGMSARDLEVLRQRIDRRLQSCAIDGADGAEPYTVRRRSVAFSLLLCPACVERHRLPEGRAQSAENELDA